MAIVYILALGVTSGAGALYTHRYSQIVMGIPALFRESSLSFSFTQKSEYFFEVVPHILFIVFII